MNQIIDEIMRQLEAAASEETELMLVIDGMCGSGKTTLADELGRRYSCNVFHMDDFYLPIVMQTEKRLSEPGGNINFDRFVAEVEVPLMQGQDILYRPFGCISQSYMEATPLKATKINIIEGTYSCHPVLRRFYEQSPDRRVITLFLDIEDNIRLERLLKRVGEQRLKLFKDKWIPREKEYFDAYAVREYCDYSASGTDDSIATLSALPMRV